MTLMTNGKKVDALALGGTEFYSIDKNTDGSISFNGKKYYPFVVNPSGNYSVSNPYGAYFDVTVDKEGNFIFNGASAGNIDFSNMTVHKYLL